MEEVHKRIAFIEFVIAIDRQVHIIVGALMRLINLALQLLLSVLIRDVAHHHIGSLLLARDNSLN